MLAFVPASIVEHSVSRMTGTGGTVQGAQEADTGDFRVKVGDRVGFGEIGSQNELYGSVKG